MGIIVKPFGAATAATLFVLFTSSALAIDYHPPFPPVVALGGATRLIYADSPVELLVTEAESGGRFGMVVLYNKPNEGPPGDNALLEYKLTETYYVLAGHYRFTVGDEAYAGGPGTVVVNPPNVPHGFVNDGQDIGKLLVIYTPADGSRGTSFFTNWADQVTRSPEAIDKLNQAYGIDRPAK